MQHDYTKWKAPQIHSHKGLEAFLEAPREADGIHAIEICEGHILDCLVRKRKSRHGLVVFNAAVNRQEFPNPPVLYGQGMAAALGVNLISVSDLALTYDPKIEMGWHSGAQNAPMQNHLPKILEHFRKSLDLDKMVLFGGSAGGFAAMYYANVMGDVLPVAANPQSVITRFHPRHVEAYAEKCWGWDKTADIEAFLSGKICQSLLPLYAANPHPFIYLQNTGDDHLAKHALPFMQAIDGGQDVASRKVGSGYMHFAEWGKGHVSAPKEVITDYLSKAFAFEGSWAGLMDTLGAS